VGSRGGVTGVLEHLAAKAALGQFESRELPVAAAAALERGFDSPALRVLAGLTGDDLVEVPEYLDRALAELDVEIPERRDAVLHLARAVATEIVDGTLAPSDGAARIWDIALLAPEVRVAELDTFVYAASEWDERPEDHPRFEAGIREGARDLVLRSSSLSGGEPRIDER